MQTATPSFNNTVLPFVTKSCYQCHNATRKAGAAPKDGEAVLWLRYQNPTRKTLPYSLQIGNTSARRIDLPPTSGGQWQTYDQNVTLQRGANIVALRGLVEAWESVSLENLELIAR